MMIYSHWKINPSQVGDDYYDIFLYDENGKSMGVPFLLEPYMLKSTSKMEETLYKLADYFNQLLPSTNPDDPIVIFTDMVTNRLKFGSDNRFYVE